MNNSTIIEIQEAKKHFPVKSGGIFRRTDAYAKAVDGVSISIDERSTVGLVGESGCGKSTLAKLILGLEPLTDGQITFHGTPLTHMSSGQRKDYRIAVQAVFQDPYDSLNPRLRVFDLVSEPLLQTNRTTRKERENRVHEVLEMVGLPLDVGRLYPHEFSGGQRQRIAIARAITSRPSLIILDEPVSALDVSIRAQILNLLRDLQDQIGTSYLFIAHDLHAVEFMSDVVAVMYLGKIVEIAPTDELRNHRLHPYTQSLFSAIPRPDPNDPGGETIAHGEPPDPVNPPPGCHFHTRCFMAQSICSETEPQLRQVRPNHLVSCHFA